MKMPRSHVVWRYGLAVLAVVLLLLTSILLRRFNLTFNLTWLIVAILLFVAWYGGRGPGLLAAFLFALAINYFTPPGFKLKYNVAEFNRLGVLALLAVMASSRRQAEEKLKVRARQQAAVAQLGQQALAGSARAPLSSLLDKAAALAARHVEVEFSSIWELLPDGQTLQSRAGLGWKEGIVGHATLSAGTASQAGYALLSHEPIIVTDLRRETRFTAPPLLRDHQVASGVSVIIPGSHRPFGVLSVHATKRRKYTTDDLNFLQALANVLAEAIGRQRAEAEIGKLNEELEERVIERTSQLEAANKELEAFSYSISHDLRAPLRAINGFSRILLEDFAPTLPHEAQDHLHLVSNNAEQMGHLIDDLLSFSRLSRQPLHKRPVDPANVARQVISELSAEQRGRRVTISIADLPMCQADPALLKQVFVNLLTNALKFTKQREEAVIEIGSRQGGAAPGEPIYYVTDNGAGFEMQYADKLFGVFQRLHCAEDYEGTGVGLAIVQRIVIRHGGRVWAEAEVNQGATFFFTLAGANHD